MTASTYKDMRESCKPYTEQNALYKKSKLYMKFQKGQAIQNYGCLGVRKSLTEDTRIPGDVEMFNIVIGIIWIYPFKKILEVRSPYFNVCQLHLKSN